MISASCCPCVSTSKVVYVFMCVCSCVCVHLCVLMCVCSCVCAHVCVFMCVCVFTRHSCHSYRPSLTAPSLPFPPPPLHHPPAHNVAHFNNTIRQLGCCGPRSPELSASARLLSPAPPGPAPSSPRSRISSASQKNSISLSFPVGRAALWSLFLFSRGCFSASHDLGLI